MVSVTQVAFERVPAVEQQPVRVTVPQSSDVFLDGSDGALRREAVVRITADRTARVNHLRVAGTAELSSSLAVEGGSGLRYDTAIACA